jgi:hypothetical protein
MLSERSKSPSLQSIRLSTTTNVGVTRMLPGKDTVNVQKSYIVYFNAYRNSAVSSHARLEAFVIQTQLYLVA